MEGRETNFFLLVGFLDEFVCVGEVVVGCALVDRGRDVGCIVEEGVGVQGPRGVVVGALEGGWGGGECDITVGQAVCDFWRRLG